MPPQVGKSLASISTSCFRSQHLCPNIELGGFGWVALLTQRRSLHFLTAGELLDGNCLPILSLSISRKFLRKMNRPCGRPGVRFHPGADNAAYFSFRSRQTSSICCIEHLRSGLMASSAIPTLLNLLGVLSACRRIMQFAISCMLKTRASKAALSSSWG